MITAAALPFNLTAYVLARAGGLAEKPALEIIGGERYSYARLEAAVRGCGTLLLQAGLQPGDRVLLRLGNSAAFPILFLAAIAVGVVPVPSSAALTVAEISAMARAIAPALVVAGPGVSRPEGDYRTLDAAEIARAEHLPACDYDRGDAGRLAYIVFTSGTSGRPLPVAHAHRAVLARQLMHQGWEGLGDEDRLMHAGAMNWTYTLGTGLIDPWTLGATAVIPAPGTRPTALADLLAHSAATIFAAAPGVYRQMLRVPFPALPRLRHGLSAGEAMPEAVADDWQSATGTRVHPALGLSECSTFVSGAPDRPAPPGTAGYPQAGRRIAVLGPDGAPVAPGEAGTLAIHRSDPGLMLGYVDLPEQTAARFRGDWFITGDRVSQAEDGAIRFLGREDDMMNPGGYRVSPLEVEAELASLPGVTDCAVVEAEVTPGSRIILCFYAAQDAISEGRWTDHIATRLARYKQPRRFIRLDALPRNANNKLDRAALRGLAAATVSSRE